MACGSQNVDGVRRRRACTPARSALAVLAVGVALTVTAAGAASTARPERSRASFDAFLLGVARDVNGFWSAAFRQANLAYRVPRLYIVDRNQSVREPCDARPVPGTLQNAFWCQRDRNVYLFSDFLRRVVDRESGDFGVAYVIAHEWGHHIQGELGIWNDVARRHIRTIKTELQADCFAGIWARSAYDRGVVNDVDIRQVIAATDLAGDARGVGRTNSGAHGQSGLRYAWWKNGFTGGSTDDCETF